MFPNEPKAQFARPAEMTTAPPFKRKNIRLPQDRYRGRGLYFVTLCFADRTRFGANPRLASWLVARLRRHASESHFFVHAFCVMPDHLHILAAGALESSNLMKFVEAFKQETGAAFSRRTARRLWQFKYYDRILRGSDSADRVAWYIWMNPVRKGLCGSPKQYPYLGSFTQIGTRILEMSAAPEWVPPWKDTLSAALKAAALR
jgi:REP element-mobilizing transposase RayT